MANAGHKISLYLTGGAVAMLEEAMTSQGLGLYQVTNASRDVWDWTQTLDVESSSDGGTTWDPVSPSAYTVKWLSGRIQFDNTAFSEQVRVSGFYLPKFSWASANSVDFEDTSADLDVSSFESSNVQRIQGLGDCAASVSGFQVLNTPIDGEGGTEDSIHDHLQGRKFLVMVLHPNEDAALDIRAVLYPTTKSLSMSVDSVQESSLDLVGVAPRLGSTQITFEYT